ncbi:MAG: hypothetical protein GVY18_08720 [Bacteroidetes bacterium]|jgi:uncharacterized tellurite resistance protein B-like protein|nr:hypothetical protein [Bacteroidota bacterium]
MPVTTGPEDWGTLHDLALLYLFLAHATDDHLDPVERSTISERLHAWRPKAPSTRIDKILNEVMLTYMGTYGRDMLDMSIASLKESLHSQRRVEVLNDMATLATSDGVLAPGEIAFIQRLARFWDVEDDVPTMQRGSSGGDA